MPDMPKLRIAPLSEFRQDDENANKGTPRGKELLKKSLQQRRFARPTFAAADGTILGGNKTLESAKEVGMDEAIIVESDGSRPIIHVRTDLANSKSPAARKLATEDNRIAELSLSWDEEMLGALAEFDDEILKDLWDDEKIKRLQNIIELADDQSGLLQQRFQILIDCDDENMQKEILEKLSAEGIECRALIA